MTLVRKHSVSIRGHRTSFSLEDAFYDIIEAIAQARNLPVAAVIIDVDDQRDKESNLSSALRVYALEWVKQNPSKTA